MYGETEDESESLWSVRAESANQLLHNVLIAAGAQPDSLIPEDTFSFSFEPGAEENIPPLIDRYDLTGDQDTYPMITGTASSSSSSGSDGDVYTHQSVSENVGGKGDILPLPWPRTVDIDLTKTDEHGQGDITYPIGSRSGNITIDGIAVSAADQFTIPLDSGPESVGLSDGMTDEQLAAYLSSTYS